MALMAILSRAIITVKLLLRQLTPGINTAPATEDHVMNDPMSDSAQEGLALALIALSARLITHDGEETPREYAAFCDLFPMPHASADSVREHFDNALAMSTPYPLFARHLRVLTEETPALRPVILKRFFALAAADKPLNLEELRFLHSVADILGVSEAAFDHLAQSHIGVPTHDPIALMNMPKGATGRELREQYHLQLQAFHPDRIALWQQEASTPREQSWLAMMKERAAALNHAYETLRSTRQFRH